MIVVAIIGILASLAVSAYQTYTVRAQVAEGLNMAGRRKNTHCRTPTYTRRRGSGEPYSQPGMSANATDTAGGYVSAVDVEDGRIEIRLRRTPCPRGYCRAAALRDAV